MAQELSAVFSRMQEKKKQQRELKAMYKDSLSVNGEYQKILEELEDLKIKKKQIENSVKADFKEEFDKLEGLKLNIASDNQLLSDLALTQFSKGELRRLVDENKVEYEPIFTVRFKKA
jgi:predicted  nucleic acid-binding Zn-ribbon protein